MKALLLLCALVAFASADALLPADLAAFQDIRSRTCENYNGLQFLRREFFFTQTHFESRVTYFIDNECLQPGAVLRTNGTYNITAAPSGQVPYTEVSFIDFFPAFRTLMPTRDEFVQYYRGLECFANTTFQDAVATDILDITCEELGFTAAQNCSGEQDIVAEYHNAIFFGEDGGKCEGERPTLLSTFGLLKILEEDYDYLRTHRSLRFYTYIPGYVREVRSKNIMETIRQQSSYFNRYFSSVSGVRAANDIYEAFQKAAVYSNNNVQVELFDNSALETGFLQPTVIARFVGSASGAAGESLVILGAHFDTANLYDDAGMSTLRDDGREDPRWFTRRSPGADANMSGTAALIEVFRALVRLGFRPERTVEFHAYAGQEIGLVDGVYTTKAGSELMVRHLRQTGKEVSVYMNFDGIGIPYDLSDECNPLRVATQKLLVFGDPATPEGQNIDPEARDLFYNCAERYTEEPWGAAYGPNGDSDHLSYIGHNYPAAAAAESNIAESGYNQCGFDRQTHHTERDTIDTINEEYLHQFARSMFAFAVEASALPTSGLVVFDQPPLSADTVDFVFAVSSSDAAHLVAPLSVLFVALLALLA